MRAENEAPDADASGISNARALASLVACLAALNAPAEPAAAEHPPPVAAARRARFAPPPMSYRLAAPVLAVLMVVVATPSLADREFGVQITPAVPTQAGPAPG